MELDFEKVITKIKKQPLIIFAVVFVILGIFVFLKIRKNNSENEEEVISYQEQKPISTTTTTDTTTLKNDILEQTKEIVDRNTERTENLIGQTNKNLYDSLNNDFGNTIQNLSQTIVDYQVKNANELINLSNQMEKDRQFLEQKYNLMSVELDNSINRVLVQPQPIQPQPVQPQTVQPQPVQPQPVQQQPVQPQPVQPQPVQQVTPVKNVAKSLFDEQVEAYKSIKNLGNLWKQNKVDFMKDNKIDNLEQIRLDEFNKEANRISIKAGFGDGGKDGSKRVIPIEVKKVVDGG